jgi:hypothetical protein
MGTFGRDLAVSVSRVHACDCSLEFTCCIERCAACENNPPLRSTLPSRTHHPTHPRLPIHPTPAFSLPKKTQPILAPHRTEKMQVLQYLSFSHLSLLTLVPHADFFQLKNFYIRKLQNLTKFLDDFLFTGGNCRAVII